ncbi:MAG: hypothetical protein PHQ23_11405 [Candidatus Wallbacteria bacterium]|nr:hypothetical protein [Candidatus Wallbacteria bacterium]
MLHTDNLKEKAFRAISAENIGSLKKIGDVIIEDRNQIVNTWGPCR